MFLRLDIPRIDKNLEQKFTLEYNKRTLPFARFTFFIVIVFLGFYYYLDYISGPHSYKTLWLIRTFGLLIPSILMFFISLWKKFYLYYQPIMAAYILLMSTSIIGMVYTCQSNELCFNFYFIGILTINALTLVSRLKYKNAFLIYIITTLLYIFVAIKKQRLTGYFLYNDILFFVSVLTAFSLAHLFLESYMRNLFLSENKLTEANEELVYQNQKIFQQNEELQILMSKLKEQKEELEVYNKKMRDSINYAHRIQRAILPDEEQLRQAVSDYFIYFYPKDVVSGDFYWWSRKADYLFVALADCTGHGVPGAFMSMLGVSLLEKIIITQNINDTGKAVMTLTQNLIKLLKHDKDKIISDSIDISLIRIDLKNWKLQTSGIHINSFILCQRKLDVEDINLRLFEANNAYLYEIKSYKFQVGYHKLSRFRFDAVEIPIQPGDQIFVFSDGLTDQMSPELHKFTKARVRNLLIELDSFPLRTKGEKIIAAFDAWKKEYHQTDDVLFIGLQL